MLLIKIQTYIFVILGVEASIRKFLEAAKSLEADFLRKQMYSRVNHPQEVTKEVKFHAWRGLSITLFLFVTVVTYCSIFEQCSGLKINSTKSEAIWLGNSGNNCSKLYDLKWPEDPIVALGTAFSYDVYKCEVKNFHEKATKMQKMFNLWSQRDLSLYGKMTIAKPLDFQK